MGDFSGSLTVVIFAAVCLAAGGTLALASDEVPSSGFSLLGSRRCWSAITHKQSTSSEKDSEITPRTIGFVSKLGHAYLSSGADGPAIGSFERFSDLARQSAGQLDWRGL